jgi:hypothetical protein
MLPAVLETYNELPIWDGNASSTFARSIGLVTRVHDPEERLTAQNDHVHL